MRIIIYSIIFVLTSLEIKGQDLTLNFSLSGFEVFDYSSFAQEIFKHQSNSPVSEVGFTADVKLMFDFKKTSVKNYYAGFLYQKNTSANLPWGTIIVGNYSELETFKFSVGRISEFTNFKKIKYGYGVFYKSRLFTNTQSKSLSKTTSGLEASISYEQPVNLFFIKRLFIQGSVYPDLLTIEGFIVSEDYSGSEPGLWNFSIGLGINLFKPKKEKK